MTEQDKVADEIVRLRNRRRELAKQCWDLAREDDNIGYLRMLDVFAGVTRDIQSLHFTIRVLNEAPPYEADDA